MRAKKFLLLLLAFFIGLQFTVISEAEASPEREFIMSCTYGVLAGTLVGAATLAFTDQPGENLNQVARGASLGLYLGIALGAYVVYVVPRQIEKENDIYQQPGYPGTEEEQYEYQGDEYGYFNNFQMFPYFDEKGSVGLGAQVEVLSF